MDLKLFIKTLDMFKNCSEIVVDELIPLFKLQEYEKENLIFEEDTIGESVYIIFSGRVEIIKNYGKTNQKLLSVLNERDIFGEMGLFSVVKRTATAVSKTDSKILVINTQQFKKVFMKFPEEGIKIVEWLLFNMGSRLEQTSRELAAINTISYLMIESLSEQNGLQKFLSRAGYEIYNATNMEFTVGIYLYNMFIEEFELKSLYGEKTELFKQSYDKNDKFVTDMMWCKKDNCVVVEEKEYKFLFYPMLHLNNVIGFIMIVSKYVQFSQRVKDLVGSITNLISVSISNLKQLEEEREKQKLKQMKDRYLI